jgi:fatty-acyl-CoA synthase
MTARGNENTKAALDAWVRALALTARIERDAARTLPAVIDAQALTRGAAPALIGSDTALSYRELAAAANRYSRWGLSQGLRAGEVVCLLSPNCPEYLAVWLGLSRIRVTVALLNTHLTGELLAHSIRIVAPRYVIAAGAPAAALASARGLLPPELRLGALGPGGPNLPPLEAEIAACDSSPLKAAEYDAATLEDRALYVYTSGTTGLPKAASVSHYRLMQWSHWFAGLMNTRPEDRMYDCLPLYHSVGGVVATGATLVGGGAVVVRERFSARDFWRDVIAERCTLFQYIGELCRYLAASPPDPSERQHTLRLCCGNGLRAEVWAEFESRFAIPRILEYYASTEGSFSLYNCEGRPGAIGRIPPFLAHRMPVVLVKLDESQGEPLRDARGLCVPCAANEPGEALGMVSDADGRATGRFEGYADPAASAGKLLRNVLAPGDLWYRTGDLMRRDEQGFFYFVDRIGDTFRWKGENVSTTEVADVIAGCSGVRDVVVYGVALPKADGRAGMAALVVSADFDLEELRRSLVARLPAYARPVLLRIVPALQLTATFKLKKHDLAQQGYDPTQIRDALYLDDVPAHRYVPLDLALYQRLRAGSLRL